MAVQNVVSAVLAADAKAEILQGITDIQGKLDFLLGLQANEKAGLFKAGKELVPFMEECHEVAKGHPEILSPVFDRVEFERDWQLSRDLGEISGRLGELLEGVEHTLTAARSDSLMASLDIYAAVKLHQDKVPGLRLTAERLGTWFKKAPTKAKSAKA